MTDAPSSLRVAREETIDALCADFARDGLGMAELERRLARAREARTRDELRALLADLSVPAAPAPAPIPSRGTGPVEPADATRATPSARGRKEEIRPGSHVAFAVMGGTRRTGKWAPPGRMLAVAIMGGVELDFREATLAPGVTEINIFAFWGGVEIIVPPDVHVDTHGIALMGGFDEVAELATSPPEGAPTIRINGVAIMAGVEIQVRQRGERKGKGKRRKIIVSAL